MRYMSNWTQSIIRPFFGLVAIQPIVLLWLWITTDNMWDNYINTGWVLQGMITIYLIPIYHYYEKLCERIKNAYSLMSYY